MFRADVQHYIQHKKYEVDGAEAMEIEPVTGH